MFPNKKTEHTMTRNYKMILSYDGSRYYGWEHQPNTELTIQGKLEQVLTRMIYGDQYQADRRRGACTCDDRQCAARYR